MQVFEKRLPFNNPRSTSYLYFLTNGTYLTTNEVALLPSVASQLPRRTPLGMAPEITVNDLAGKPLKLSEFRGKYILLDFWVTWLPMCVAAIPHLKKTSDEFNGRDDFILIGVSLDKTIETVREFANTNSLSGVQAFLSHQEVERVSQQYNLRGFPDIFLIAPDGNILEADIAIRKPNEQGVT